MGADYKKADKSLIPISSHALAHPANSTGYVCQGYSANIFRTAMIITWIGVIRNLFIELDTAPGGADTQIFTVMVNGAPTAITLTITGAQLAGNDIVNQVAVAPGDLVTVRIVSSATAAGARIAGGLGYRT